MALWQRLAKIGNMQAGPETFNQQRCSPDSCHSVTLGKVLLFVKAAPFFARKVTAAISVGAVNTLAFWTPRSGPPQYVEDEEDLPLRFASAVPDADA